MRDDDIDPSVLIFDLETCAHPDAQQYLEPVQAAANLRDPAKIAIDILERTQARDARLALDWNVGRIACLGWWTQRDGRSISSCLDEAQEASVLRDFWQACRHRTLCGFNVKSFDLPYLMQRSRLLGVRHPVLDLSPWNERGIIDLFLRLTFNQGTREQGAMRRTLTMFAKRFGIDVPEDISGKDVPALVAAGDWAAVEQHCRQDVELTVALARKLGVLSYQIETTSAADAVPVFIEHQPEVL